MIPLQRAPRREIPAGRLRLPAGFRPKASPWGGRFNMHKPLSKHFLIEPEFPTNSGFCVYASFVSLMTAMVTAPKRLAALLL